MQEGYCAIYFETHPRIAIQDKLTTKLVLPVRSTKPEAVLCIYYAARQARLN